LHQYRSKTFREQCHGEGKEGHSLCNQVQQQNQGEHSKCIRRESAAWTGDFESLLRDAAVC